MPFPIIPVAVTAGIGTLGYLLFGKKDSASAPASNQLPPATASPQLQQIPNSTVPHKPTLPAAKRPDDLPPPVAPAPVIPQPSSGPIAPPVAPVMPPPPPPLVIPPVSPPPAVNPLPPLPLPQPPTPPAPVPPPVAPTDQTGTVTAPSGVNLRGAPSTTGPILYGMSRGTRVKILNHLPITTKEAPQGWYHVLAPNGMVGYSSAEHILRDGIAPLAPPPAPALPNIPGLLPAVLPSLPSNPIIPVPVAPPPPPGALTATVLGTPGANLRASPNTGGTLIKGLFNGTKVQVLNPVPQNIGQSGAVKGWLQVKAPTGETGYMSAEFLRLDGPSFGDDDYERVVRQMNPRRVRTSIGR